jgi:membrane-bound lytic murein transglycosylase A
MKRSLIIFLMLILTAGATRTPPPVEVPELPPPPIELPPPPPVKVDPLQPVGWEDVDGWQTDDPTSALEVFQQSCRAIAHRIRWQMVCEEAAKIGPVGEQVAREYFETFFQPHQVRNEDGTDVGLITGYYGPELPGSRVPTEKFRYPLYAQPDDLLIVDLDEIYPELNNYRLRGRVVGNRVVPYFERSEIDNGSDPLLGHELFWVEDPVELFFLHIQGSGRIRLPDGELVMVNYANQNGHRYRSIGKLLLERNAMTRDQMSMQNIRRWVNENPEAGEQLLAENPSYVFFRELPAEYTSPPGSLGIPLTAERSLAVDPRTIPLGAPVFLATNFPGSGTPLQRLMVAQDTGGAIKGRVRADFFWGMGNDAGAIAGRMKQDGRLWLLLPKSTVPPEDLDPQETFSRIQKKEQQKEN